MKKISLYTFKVVIFILIFILTFILFSYIHLSMIRSSDLKKQSKRVDKINKLYENYESEGYYPYSLENYDNYKLNEVKFLASHNSYKKKGSIIGKLFVGLGDSFKEAKALNYSYKPLTEQLKSGIYSFELDIRYRKNEFEITHVPIVDNSSTAVSFKKALLEIKEFLKNEPNSFPITVILEIKDDYMWLDPYLKQIKIKELKQLEEDISNILKNYLYSPKDMILNYNNLMERINDIGYPKISELKNKVMFIIHAGKYANKYLDEININEQLLFSSKYKDNNNLNAPFIIHNNLDVSTINELINNNYIVRTRIGDTNKYSLDDLNNALNSNAQILTSDFTVARSDINEYLYLKENKYTIIN